jgi:tetrahydromethanopterin S-methyltransferase subunit H
MESKEVVGSTKKTLIRTTSYVKNVTPAERIIGASSKNEIRVSNIKGKAIIGKKDTDVKKQERTR